MIGRNDLCNCGSGLKYKKCCLNKESSFLNLKDFYFKKYRIRLKNQYDIDQIKKAGELAIKTLDLVEKNIKAGIKTNDINDLVHNFTIQNDAKCAPLNYKGFPKSVCISINDVICHGIPSDEIIKEGDIVNVDITPILNNYYADANKTFIIGEVSNDAKKIVSVAKESLKRAMNIVCEGASLSDIGKAIQEYAEGENCSVVRDFVGHGVGFEFHEPPQVLHYFDKHNDIKLVSGMVFTIEPMINLGGKELIIKPDKWTAITKDGSLSAQFEQTILVTKTGFESLTPFDL